MTTKHNVSDENFEMLPWEKIAINAGPMWKVGPFVPMIQFTEWARRREFYSGALHVFTSLFCILPTEQVVAIQSWLKELDEKWMHSPLGSHTPQLPVAKRPETQSSKRLYPALQMAEQNHPAETATHLNGYHLNFSPQSMDNDMH